MQGTTEEAVWSCQLRNWGLSQNWEQTMKSKRKEEHNMWADLIAIDRNENQKAELAWRGK